MKRYRLIDYFITNKNNPDNHVLKLFKFSVYIFVHLCLTFNTISCNSPSCKLIRKCLLYVLLPKK